MITPWLRTVDCLDATGRDRSLVITITDDGQISLATPAPGIAVIPLLTGDVLKAYIAEAQRVGAELMLGMPAVSLTPGPLANVEVFHVLDAHDNIQRLGIGLSEGHVLANGPRQWRASEDTATAIGAKLLALGHDLRQQRRRS